MKVLQVNCVYKKGSTGKITYDIHRGLIRKGMESVVCYGRGGLIEEKSVYKTSGEVIAKVNNIVSRFTGLPYAGSYNATKKLIQIIQAEKPDIVHLHCINGFFVNIYTLINWLKRMNVRTVLTLHAEFMYTGSCGHALDCEQWKKEGGCQRCPQIRDATNSYFFDRTNYAWNRMNEAFIGFDSLRVVSVSPWLKERAECSTILKNKKHLCILNGIDTDSVFFYRQYEAEELREKMRLSEQKVVLYVSAAFTPFKGSQYIIELAKRLPELTFIVIVGRECEEREYPKNLHMIGRVDNQKELAVYYSMADITLLTSKRETFSMVCAESLACGTPVVGFKAGAPETISISDYSTFIEYGDINGVEEYLKNTERLSVEVKKRISDEAVACYSSQTMCNEYMKCYEELMNEE